MAILYSTWNNTKSNTMKNLLPVDTERRQEYLNAKLRLKYAELKYYTFCFTLLIVFVVWQLYSNCHTEVIFSPR